MDYQPKTTVMIIHPWWWTERDPKISFSSVLNATIAVAMQIACCCHMDIMSVTHIPLQEDGVCMTTVVYVNNGVLVEDVCRIMKPWIDSRPRKYWMIQDIEAWEGSLDCAVSIRGIDEKW